VAAGVPRADNGGVVKGRELERPGEAVEAGEAGGIAVETVAGTLAAGRRHAVVDPLCFYRRLATFRVVYGRLGKFGEVSVRWLSSEWFYRRLDDLEVVLDWMTSE
jgi:hypothetical protein